MSFPFNILISQIIIFAQDINYSFYFNYFNFILMETSLIRPTDQYYCSEFCSPFSQSNCCAHVDTQLFVTIIHAQSKDISERNMSLGRKTFDSWILQMFTPIVLWLIPGVSLQGAKKGVQGCAPLLFSLFRVLTWNNQDHLK